MSHIPVIFLHGWAGDLESYGKLPELLLKEDFKLEHIHLGHYTASDDALGIDDYALALNRAVRDKGIHQPFDVIVHSTGVLVVRSWLTHFFKPTDRSPIRNFIMVAPANNGSRLAGWGKKLPWDWGNKILDALQLGSHYTWELNWEWLRTQRHKNMPGLKIYQILGAKNDLVFPGFLEKFDEMLGINVPAFEEEGSDNTIRFCAANLNMRATRLEVHQKMDQSTIYEINDIPIYAFLDRSHFGDTHGLLGAIRSNKDPVFKLICDILTDRPLPRPTDLTSLPKKLNYTMLNLRVVDQLGNPYEDFIPHFYLGDADSRKAIKIAHHAENKEIDCFYIQYKNLASLQKFGFQIEKNKVGNAIYRASQYVDLHWPDMGIHFLQEKRTHLLELVIEKVVTEKAMQFEYPRVK